MKDKLQKKDMTFLLALAGFGFLCVLRYYNENMMQHHSGEPTYHTGDDGSIFPYFDRSGWAGAAQGQ